MPASAVPQPPEPRRPPPPEPRAKRKASEGIADALRRAAAPCNRALPCDLSDGDAAEEVEGEEEEWRAASELSSPNAHSIFNDLDDGPSDDDDDDDDDLPDLEEPGGAEEEVEYTLEEAHAVAMAAAAAVRAAAAEATAAPAPGGNADVGQCGRGGGRGGGGGGRGRGRGRGGGRAGATTALPEKPPRPGVTELSKAAVPWQHGATCIAIDIRTSGSIKASAAAKRIISLSAQVVRVDGRTATSPPPFHQYVATDFANAKDAPSVESEHGGAFATAWAKTKRDFSSVGRQFIDWLRMASGEATSVVLASWGGFDRDANFAVLCAELHRHGHALPWPTSVASLLDVERVLRLTLRTPHTSAAEAARAVIGEGGARADAVLSAAGAIRSPAGRRREESDGADGATDLAALLGRTAALHSVRLLAGVLGDPNGALSTRELSTQASKVAIPLEPLWSWAASLVSWEEQRRTADQLPEGWQEAPPFEEAPSTLDATVTAGPSAKLKAHIGITPTQPTVQLDLEALLLSIWLYFITPEVAEHIATAVNEKACEDVIKEGNSFRAATGKDARRRIRKRSPTLIKEPVTAGEVYRLHAVWLFMGFYPRTRVEDYWCDIVPDLRVKAISQAIEKPRFLAIMAVLSFMTSDELTSESDSLRKMRWVDAVFVEAAQSAVDLGNAPIGCLDEGRCKLLSGFCKLVSIMLCKPIVKGVTIHMLATLVRTIDGQRLPYLHNWRWPQKGEEAPGGQPTDQKPLDEGDERQTKPIMTLLKALVTPVWRKIDATLVMDKGFTSFKGLRWLATVGVAGVGMYKTRGRPAETPEGTTAHWPIRVHDEKIDGELMPRGARREVYARLPEPVAPPCAQPEVPHGTRTRPSPATDASNAPAESRWAPTWIKAELFRDARWVTLLATSWFSNALESCKRWMPSRGDRVTIRCSLALRCYHRYFNLVDRFNKKMAAMGMGMARCKRRYQRQLYIGWLLPAVARDVMVLFQCLYPTMGELRHQYRWFGLDRWLQFTSAQVLYRHGLEIDKDALGSPTTRAEQGLHPAGVPKRRKRDAAPPTPLPPRDRETHTLVNVYTHPKSLPKPKAIAPYKNHRPTEWWTSGGHCCACMALAKDLHGDVVYQFEGQRRAREGPREGGSTRHMPKDMPSHWSHVQGGKPVPRVRTACLECSRRLGKAVWLCPGCHNSEAIWDHEMAKPASQRVAVG